MTAEAMLSGNSGAHRAPLQQSTSYQAGQGPRPTKAIWLVARALSPRGGRGLSREIGGQLSSNRVLGGVRNALCRPPVMSVFCVKPGAMVNPPEPDGTAPFPGRKTRPPARLQTFHQAERPTLPAAGTACRRHGLPFPHLPAVYPPRNLCRARLLGVQRRP